MRKDWPVKDPGGLAHPPVNSAPNGADHQWKKRYSEHEGGVLPIRQTRDYSSVDLVVRTTLPPAELASAIRSALKPIEPNLPANEFRTLQQLVDKAVSPRRFVVPLLGVLFSAPFRFGQPLLVALRAGTCRYGAPEADDFLTSSRREPFRVPLHYIASNWRETPVI